MRSFLRSAPIMLLVAGSAAGGSCRSSDILACESDADCGDGLLCRSGECTSLASQCMDDSDCEAKNTCASGVCVFADTCYSDRDCPDGETCDDNVCRATACREDLCPPGFVCDSAQECVPASCDSDLECAHEHICNTETGRCADPSEIPSAEVCDGLDNNLDGNIDENFGVGESCALGLGECHEEGLIACLEDGSSACAVEPALPRQELCDGLDDDCDGFVDEDYPVNQGCIAGEGACSGGIYTCTAAGGVECVSVVGPSVEKCDYIDNDCDGVVDEGFIMEDGACVYGLGSCAVLGWQECVDDGTASICVPSVEPQPPPVSEICDGVDNDCNGVIDDGIAC